MPEKFLWLYVSVTMYNDMEQVCVGCEGIVCSKGDESYIAMTNFMISSEREKTFMLLQPMDLLLKILFQRNLKYQIPFYG